MSDFPPSAMHDTAAVWTMVTLTTSATLVTLMQSMSSLPLFLLALPAGALADTVDRRKLKDDRKVEEAVLECDECGEPRVTHHPMKNVRRVRPRRQS